MPRWSGAGGGEVGFYGAGFLEVRPAVCRVGGCLSMATRADGLCERHGQAQDALRVEATAMRAPGRGRYETAQVRRRRASAMHEHGAPVPAIASALDVEQRSVYRYLGGVR
jgi:hypothetical protein